MKFVFLSLFFSSSSLLCMYNHNEIKKQLQHWKEHTWVIEDTKMPCDLWQSEHDGQFVETYCTIDNTGSICLYQALKEKDKLFALDVVTQGTDEDGEPRLVYSPRFLRYTVLADLSWKDKIYAYMFLGRTHGRLLNEQTYVLHHSTLQWNRRTPPQQSLTKTGANAITQFCEHVLKKEGYIHPDQPYVIATNLKKCVCVIPGKNKLYVITPGAIRMDIPQKSHDCFIIFK